MNGEDLLSPTFPPLTPERLAHIKREQEAAYQATIEDIAANVLDTKRLLREAAQAKQPLAAQTYHPNAPIIPPYGRRLIEKRQRGKDVVPVVLAGCDAWQASKARADNGGDPLTLPPGHSADWYKWPIAGLRVWLIFTSPHSRADLEQIATCLLQAGATEVIAPTKCDPQTGYLCFIPVSGREAA
jgi:hypothetical protein